MAHILITRDDGSDQIELVESGDEGGYDGHCRCGWTVAGAHGYPPGLEDATQSAIIHLEISHEGGRR